MPLKIRGKLLMAFSTVIIPAIAVGGMLVFYGGFFIHKSEYKALRLAEEKTVITNLILSIEKSLMPGNDYIITGDRKYIDAFYKASEEVEKRMKEADGIVHEAEERKRLNDTVAAWQNIKEISQRIFEIRNPAGNKEAARLMEEMDYKWAYPAIERLAARREMYMAEFQEAGGRAKRYWLYSLIILFAGAFAFAAAGLFFAFFYSGRFSGSIIKIHQAADAIAGGDFKARIDIRTGDEIEQLSNAMNKMAGQLDSFYGNLEKQVKDRTKELKESVEMLELEINRMPFGHIMWDAGFRVMSWNQAAERIFGFASEEAKGKHPYDIIVPQEAQPHVDKIWQRLLEGDATAHSVNDNLTKDGRTIICEWTNTSLRNHNGDVIGVLSMVQDITERKRVEDALRGSEDKFRKITESAQDAIIMMDADKRISFWNAAAVRIFGYPQAEVMGKELHALIVPASAHAKFIQAFPHFQASGEGKLIGGVSEVTALRKGGEEFPVALSISATQLNGQWHAVGIVRDITERKKTEKALRETSNYLESLINYANAPIIVWNPAFKITRFNHAFENLTGYTADEVIGKKLGMLFPDVSREKSMENIVRTSGGEFWESVEIPIIRKDGDIRIALWNSANIYVEDGKTLIATMAQGQDITERKRIEEEILMVKNYRESILNSSADLIFTLKKDGTFGFINPRLEGVTGYKENEVKGRHFIEFIPEHRKEFMVERWNIINRGISEPAYETEVIKADGTLMNCLVTPSVVEGFDEFLVILKDITEQKKAEEKLKKQLDELERFQKVAVKREFRIKELRERIEELEGEIKRLKG